MNINGNLGKVVTKDPKHEQWNCGMGIYKPGEVYYQQDSNGRVIIDGKKCKIITKVDRDNSNIAIYNGEVFDNSFYENPNDNIIRSKLIDSIELPKGYTKCYYVHNTDLVTGTVPRIETSCILNKNYGHVYFSAKQNSVTPSSPYGSIWRTGYIDEVTNTTRAIMESSNVTKILLYSDMRAGSGGQSITNNDGIFGYEITNERKYKALVNDNEYHDLSNQTQGQENTDDKLYFLSRCADVNLYFMFVVDDSKNLTFCAVPCKNNTTGQFGIFDIVSGQFFGDDAIAGVGERLPLAANTLRFQFSKSDYDPVDAGAGSSGTWTKLMDTTENTWDWTNTNTSWATAFGGGGTGIPGAFADYENNKVKVIAAGDTSTVTDFSRFFQNCYAITEICPIDTSGATNVFIMFSHCENCKKFPDMDLSNATDVRGAYQGCHEIVSAPNIIFPSDHTYSLQNFFVNCVKLENVPLYDTSKCNNMSYMFANDNNAPSKGNLQRVPLFNTSNVTTMARMFQRCGSLKEVPNFDTSRVTNMSGMFDGILSGSPDVEMQLLTVPDFDYSKVTNFAEFMSGNVVLDTIPEMNIEASVTRCNSMFEKCPNVKSGQKALYDKLSAISTITNHADCFKDCGTNTEEGRAELAQIPTSWGGDLE